MTTAQTKAEILARIGDCAYRIRQAAAEGQARRGQLSTDARLLRLSSRYMQHRAAGRGRAAAAVKRMAMKLKEQN